MMFHFSSILKFCASQEWLRRRMLFLSGPRQVGKTTLAETHFVHKENYFNWDSKKVRSLYYKDPDFFFKTKLKPEDWICFDEIHKRPRWKDILKGAYDSYKNECRFVVTGSARLEVFKRAGDSLVGRYFQTHLFPINLADFQKKDFKFYHHPLDLIYTALDQTDSKILPDLLKLGGFPEPFYSSSETFWNRWSTQHSDLIITEDLRDLTRITELDKLEHLLEMLKPGIGSPTSNLALAQDLETSHPTIKRWLLELETVQLIFQVPPYSQHLRRTFRREVKWYFMDWRAAREQVFENYVAATLYRAVTLWNDRFGSKSSLHFIRTHDGTEVDFLICQHGKPWLLIEAKIGKPEVSSACYRFTQELNIPCIVVTALPGWGRILSKDQTHPIIQLSMGRLAKLLP